MMNFRFKIFTVDQNNVHLDAIVNDILNKMLFDTSRKQK